MIAKPTQANRVIIYSGYGASLGHGKRESFQAGISSPTHMNTPPLLQLAWTNHVCSQPARCNKVQKETGASAMQAINFST